VLLEQNIKGEQCAISVYKKIIDYTKDKDPVTYDIALQIMSDEIEHEEDLEAIQDDIKMMFAKSK
jgi:bacterioferritin